MSGTQNTQNISEPKAGTEAPSTEVEEQKVNAHQIGSETNYVSSDSSVPLSCNTVKYEWEEELEEYDEPDIYPSEKDYKWFEEQVTDDEEEEVIKKGAKPSEEESRDNTEDQPPKELETEGDDTKPGESEQDQQQKTAEGEDAEEEEHFAPSEDAEHEEEEDATPKKKYKTIMVKKLIQRPPKIYHVAEKIRVLDATSNPEDYHQKPIRFLHSFGYDCRTLGNLRVLDDSTLMFMSGFVLTFYNHKTSEKSYLRCLGGGSFGSISLHPSRKLFAAAEKGVRPIIGIWSWPKLQLFRKLEDGTANVYASVNFSPDGKLLASQGGEPDFLITVWNWLSQAPILRVKSHVQDVYRVTFAKELAGLLTTSGLCHIKFWKMAGTFTGLKLKGDLGRFGRTEISDIEGYVEMPDGKVLSGTEWGNLLVWENGLVIAELCISNALPCHSGTVRQILMVEGDFYTTGQDGSIRVWRYEDVDTAEIRTTVDSLKVPTRPISQVLISEDSDVWSICQDPFNNDDVSVYWFAQDGMGYIWQVDLSFLNIAKEPQTVLTAHGGPIYDSAMSNTGNMLTTVGGSGSVIVYDYVTKNQLASRRFTAAGTCVLWPKKDDYHDGFTIIVGFADGVLRILSLSSEPGSKTFPLSLALRVVWKPHRNFVSSISLNSDGVYLATAGEDGTVFLFHACNNFTPLCYIEMPDLLPVDKVFWSLSKDATNDILFAICRGAYIQEIEIPPLENIDNTTSYCYKGPAFLRNCKVKSIKSVLRHNEELSRMQREEEERQAAIERENERLIEDGIETKEEQDARLLDEALAKEIARAKQGKKDKKWEPYIPPKTSPILEAYQDYLNPDVLRFTMGDYDAGYLYSIRLHNEDQKFVMGKDLEEPFDAVPLPDTDDVPVNKIIFYKEGEMVLMGLQDGRVRVSRLSSEYDLESELSHWTTGLHDVNRGKITSFSIDQCESYLVSTGMDGNCFLHTFLSESGLENLKRDEEEVNIPLVRDSADIFDIRMADAYTLEDSKNVEKERAMLSAARKNKAAKRDKIAQLRFQFAEILTINNEMPEEVRLTPVELNIASDNAQRFKKGYTKALEQLKKEMAWNCEYIRTSLNKLKSFYIDRIRHGFFVVKAFNSNLKVASYRLSELPEFFEDAKNKRDLHVESKHSIGDHAEEDFEDVNKLTYFVEPRPKRPEGMDKFVHQRNVRLWERKQKKINRKREWTRFLSTDPSERELVDDMAHIDDARMKIGDMKLKMDPQYKVPNERKLTVPRARQKLVALEEIMFEKQLKFNKLLISQRENKVDLLDRLKEYVNKIIVYQKDLSASRHIPLPTIPSMSVEEDPNALVNYSKEDVLAFQQKMQAKKSAEGRSASKRNEMPKRRRKSFSGLSKDKSDKTDADTAQQDIEIIESIPSSLELQIQEIKSVQAEFYQKYYVECIEKEKHMFDARLKLLMHKKVKLDYDLKKAEEYMLTLTQEFILAQKSESMEANLEYTVKESTKEKRVCTTSMKSLQKNVDSIKTQLETISSKRNCLLKEVQEIATAAPNYEKYLQRVFKKKITASKKKKSSDDEEDVSEDSDDSDDSDDMDMDDDEDDDDGLDVDLPPSDLKSEIYEAVIAVRNRRLALDEKEVKAKLTQDDLMTQINGFKNRIGVADATLGRTKMELDKFNLEKQTNINSMEGTVSLNFHQIFYSSNELECGLVINRSGIRRLRDRIPELLRERQEEKKRVNTTRLQYRRLYHEDKKYQKSLDLMEKRCNHEMLLKFGRVKPIEELEYFQEDPEITKMKRELREMEERGNEMMRELDRELFELSAEFSKVSNEEKEKLIVQVKLNEELSSINKAMDTTINVLPRRTGGTTSVTNEIFDLKELLQNQAYEIHNLQCQIMALSMKSRIPLPPIRNGKVDDMT